MTQTSLFTEKRTRWGEQRFYGPDVSLRDEVRLTGLLARVAEFMSDGRFHTLAEIQRACGGTEASCSARLRQLDNDHGYEKTRKRGDSPGVFVYRVVKP